MAFSLSTLSCLLLMSVFMSCLDSYVDFVSVVSDVTKREFHSKLHDPFGLSTMFPES